MLGVTACQVTGLLVVVYAACSVWQGLLLLAGLLMLLTLLGRWLQRRAYPDLAAADRVLLVTGCDTGIGLATAVAGSERGLRVVACCLQEESAGARRLAALPNVHVVPLDVSREDSVQAAARRVRTLCGESGLWAVVNNAGFNHQAPVELTSMATYQQVSDVMLFGTVRVTKALLPLVRLARGRVVTMSSDRGMLSPANSSAYCIAKHGIETFSDVLRAEMKRFGVAVSVIQPGHFGAATAIINTQALQGIKKALERDAAECSLEVRETYDGQSFVDDIIQSCINSRQTSATDVAPIVQAILHAVLSNRPHHRYPVHGSTGPLDWGIVLGQVKPLLPDSIFDGLQALVWRLMKK